MSRSSTAVLTTTPLQSLLLLPLILHASTVRAAPTASVVTPDISCSLKSCSAVDVALLNEYVTSLNSSIVSTTLRTAPTRSTTTLPSGEEDVNGFSQLESLPFGVLASDWSRLLLLQNRQPEGTALRDNLLRLSRLMLAAYFYSQDSGDSRPSPEEDGRRDGVTIGTLTTVPETESEDQQANNVTLGSTVQKESTWINASTAGIATTYNNEKQQQQQQQQQYSSGNFSGNENDKTTMSHYDSSAPTTEGTNFNQSFSTLDADNEASGNKSNETLATDNEDESSRNAVRTSEHFFVSSPPLLDEPKGENHQSDEGIISKNHFTSNVAGTSSENEAVHDRSKEDFMASRYREKEIKESDVINKTTSRNSTKSFKENERVEKKLRKSHEDLFTDDDVNNSNDTVATSSMENDSSEFNSTKSIKESFASVGTPENFANKHNTVTIKAPLDPTLDIKSEDSEENATQSFDELFASLDAINETNAPEFTNNTESANNEQLLPKIVRDFFFSSSENPNVRPAKSVENFLKNTKEEDKIMNKVPLLLESDKILNRASGKWNETLTGSLTKFEKAAIENSTFPDSIFNETVSSQSGQDFNISRADAISANSQTNESLDSFESIPSEELFKAFFDNEESNLTDVGKNDNNLTTSTTLAQLISGGFSGEISASAVAYSNEITPAFDSTTPANGKEDRFTKYPDTTATISPGLLVNTTDQDKAEGKAHTPTSEIDGSYENRTTNRDDDLFSELTTKPRPKDDWNSTSTASIEHASHEATTPLAHASRKILMYIQHPTNNKVASAFDALKAAEESQQRENGDENEDDMWELEENVFNPVAVSLKNQRHRRSSNGIAAEARMNKRKPRKRADLELDVERQYRTFVGPEHRQTQFAEKRADEKAKSQGARVEQ